MSWTVPRTWTAGEIVTAALGNTHWRDNLRYLKGLDGVITLSDALILPDGAGFYLHIPILTTTQRDAIASPTNGMMIYNSTLLTFNKYENGDWQADLGFNSAHSGLSGLTAGDDHTQYQKESLLTTAGDIAYATGASVWARLGIGTAGQFLKTNAGATAPEWTASPAVPSGGIIMWSGTIANIPSGFLICDGAGGSTPNLLGRFIQGVATAATDPGATGGATSKSLNLGADYSISGELNRVVVRTGYETETMSAGTAAAGTGRKPVANLISDIRPLFFDLAFLLKT